MSLALLATVATKTPEIEPTNTQIVIQIEQALAPKQEKFEDISLPLVRAAERRALAARKKACRDAGGTFNANTCVYPPPPVPKPIYTPVVAYIGTLMGHLGYAHPWGNCILEPGVNNPGYGSPMNWPALTQTPHIGATVLFWYNHTGVITGLWSNGDIEIRHQNYYGGQHRFPRSAFRGYR